MLNDFRNLRVVGLAENEMLMGPIPRISDPLRLRSERKRQNDPIEQSYKNDARDNPVYREELGYPHSLETHACKMDSPRLVLWALLEGQSNVICVPVR